MLSIYFFYCCLRIVLAGEFAITRSLLTRSERLEKKDDDSALLETFEERILSIKRCLRS